jgi:hypothetical protein
MRARDFIVEDDDLGLGLDDTDGIEDHADVRGDNILVDQLVYLQNRANEMGHSVPRVSVKTLINQVRNAGAEMFNARVLKDAYSQNDTVKNLIKNIEPDENGEEYVYLEPYEDEPTETGSDLDAANAGLGDADKENKTVAAMASRAAAS